MVEVALSKHSHKDFSSDMDSADEYVLQFDGDAEIPEVISARNTELQPRR